MEKSIEPMLKIGAGIFGVIALVAIPSCGYINSKNYAISQENGIEATYSTNQTSLTRMSNSVTDNLAISEVAKDHLTEVVKASMEGRYGNDKTVMAKAVTEAYPGNLNPELYTRIMDEVTSGRTNFQNEQNMLIDKVRAYKTETEYVGWRSFWMGMAGYPKIDFAKYNPIISDYTNDAFTTKRDNGLNIGGKK